MVLCSRNEQRRFYGIGTVSKTVVTCENCDKRKDCKALCPEVKKYLKKNNIYSVDWIRHKISSCRRDGKGEWREIPFSAIRTRGKDGEWVVPSKDI